MLCQIACNMLWTNAVKTMDYLEGRTVVFMIILTSNQRRKFLTYTTCTYNNRPSHMYLLLMTGIHEYLNLPYWDPLHLCVPLKFKIPQRTGQPLPLVEPLDYVPRVHGHYLSYTDEDAFIKVYHNHNTYLCFQDAIFIPDLRHNNPLSSHFGKVPFAP